MIPEMTDPLSKYWVQPDRSEVTLIGKNAYMSEEAAKKLHRYDTSLPTGVYVGKMWAKGNRKDDSLKLGWYDHVEGDQMMIEWRDLFVGQNVTE